jgi:hypothetical protein
MARGEHPQRTPFYGALLLMGAGFIMTFRDYDFPRRRR